MPIIESAHNKDMPQIVGMAQIVDFSGKPSLWYASDVNEEGQADNNVHSDNTWNKKLKGKSKISDKPILAYGKMGFLLQNCINL